MSLSDRLPLFSFLLEEFGVQSFVDLSTTMSNPALEEPALDENSRFYHELVALIPSDAPVQASLLREYDEAIRRHTERINRHRPEQIRWRYFQYVNLLFTERFLDRLFDDQDQLLLDLNAHLQRFNDELPEGQRALPAYERSDLRKLAVWSATGSGKTLVMHVNLLQILDKYKQHGRSSDINHVLLLTPNESLSRQHLEEFALSGIDADYFGDGRGALFRGDQVEVIDIHKLKETKGEKSFPIDAFEDNNLVLVDEGHRGASGEHWMDARDRLCRNGFSFEYSATFGQAFANKPNLEDSYGKWIVFDYSYRRFYNDGYGKDFRILNFPASNTQDQRHEYLCAALLSFHQQQRYYADNEEVRARFNLAKPLWAFVGSSVTAKAVRSSGGQKVSDVVDILKTFAEILHSREVTEQTFENLLQGGGGLLDNDGASIFRNAFPYLNDLGIDGPTAFSDILGSFFNSPAPGHLRIVRLKGVDGELALQVGDCVPFGVVNVGDDAALHKLCEEEGLSVDEVVSDHSLFDGVNDGQSDINLVVGAKKFIEGWNSWRVSSLGLMRVGAGEGPQIIQLFGRGVRLKGLGFSLKRSSRLEPEPDDLPEYLHLLETLTVFGVKADYMATFRDQLEMDGVPASRTTVNVPVAVPDEWPNELRVIRPDDGVDFVSQADVISLLPEPGEAFSPAVVDWYSRLHVVLADELEGPGEVEVQNEVDLTPTALAFFDVEKAYRDLVAFKSRRGWHCLLVTPDDVNSLLERHDWYKLLMPPELVSIRSGADTKRWNEVISALLRAWCERRIKDCASLWLQPRLKYAPLGKDDPNIIDQHIVSIPSGAEDDLQETLEHIAAELVGSEEDFVSFGVGDIQVLNYGEHLYRPLLYVHEDEDIIVKPTTLNLGEKTFVNHVHAWCSGPGTAFVAENQLFLLRNQSRGRGIGFFEAGNFYPDFIIWILSEDAQRIIFVDPKGVVRLEGTEHPKVKLHSTIKNLEARLGDTEVRLSSFIISVTAFENVPWWNGEKVELEREHHVLFQEPDAVNYIGRMIELAMKDTAVPAVLEEVSS